MLYLSLIKKIYYLLGDSKKMFYWLVLLFLINSSIEMLGISLIIPYIGLVFNGELEDFNLDYFDNFLQCEHIISKTLDKSAKSKLFRPPYGKIKKSQAKPILKKGYRIIMWDVLSADFDVSTSNEECLRNVLNNTKNGSIIVFHDSVKASEKLKFVLPKVLKEFSEQGFVFKAI